MATSNTTPNSADQTSSDTPGHNSSTVDPTTQNTVEASLDTKYGETKPHRDGARRNKKEAKRRSAKKRKLRKRLEAYSVSDSDRDAEQCFTTDEYRQMAEDAPERLDVQNDGSEILRLLKSIQVPEGTNQTEVDVWFSHFENLIILGYQVYRAESFTDFFIAMCSYIKMNTNKSVTCMLAKLIDELVETTPQPKLESWSGAELRSNWNLFKDHKMFTRISYLMTAAMSMSICSMKEIEWSPWGLKVISLKAAEKQLEAVDVIDALICTFTWMCETGWRVFETKSLKPLLFEDQEMQKYIELSDKVLLSADQIINGNSGCLQQLEKEVDELISKTTQIKATKPESPAAFWLSSRHQKLAELKFKIIARHKNTALRYFPLGWAITGDPGVGKSVLQKSLMMISLRAMGFEYSDSRVITYDLFDQYDTTVTSDLLGMYFDDIAQGKPQFEQSSPFNLILKMFNNVAAQAVKASLEDKGTVFINFKCGVLTSNHMDLNARHYTDCPEAILRRFHFLRMVVKPEYRAPGSSKLNTSHPIFKTDELFPDCWDITLEDPVTRSNKHGNTTYFWETKVHKIDGQDRLCENISIVDLMDVVVDIAREHHEHQERLIKGNKALEEAPWCKTCVKVVRYCKCTDPEVVNPTCKCKGKCSGTCHLKLESMMENIVEVASNSVLSAGKRYITNMFAPYKWYGVALGFEPVRAMATSRISHQLTQVLEETATPWIVQWTPDFVFESNLFQRMIRMAHSHSATHEVSNHISLLSFGSGVSLLGFLTARNATTSAKFLGCTALQVGGVYALFAHRRARIQQMRQEYLARRDALPEYWKQVRNSSATKIGTVVVTLIVGAKLISFWNSTRLSVEASGKPSTSTLEAGEQKDINSDDSPGWFGYMMDKMNITIKTKNTNSTTRHVLETLQKDNLYWAEFEYSPRVGEHKMTARTNVFFPRKNIALFPYHNFFKDFSSEKELHDLLRVTVKRGNGKAGGQFKFVVNRNMVYKFPNLDMVMAFVPNCPDMRDKSKYLPTSVPTGTCVAHVVTHTLEQFKTFPVNITMKNFDLWSLGGRVNGGVWMGTQNTLGYCMSPIVTLSKQPIIAGFHVADASGCKYFQTLTQEDYTTALAELQSMSHVCLSAGKGEMPEKQMGRLVLESERVHPNCMAARLTETDCVEVLGATKLRMSQKSSVIKSPISDAIQLHCADPNYWGPPKMRPNWEAYNKTLEHIVNPSEQFDPALLEKARQDYLLPLKESILEYVKNEDFRVLTDKEAILGIDGKRFIDALKMGTSCGFPLFGPKSRYFEEIREEGLLLDRVPSECIEEELSRLYSCWEKGERAYPVVTATLKDEPTNIASEKVRVFQANGVCLSIWIRKFFLPIARFISKHPLLSESAVGINCMGPEWQVVMNHVFTHDDDNQVIAWDYSKYDVRMNSQMVVAVFKTFIDIAELGGYDEKDLYIMRMMVNDIAHPLIDYNGVMLMAFNINTSGNSMTVYINSLAGSLYVRMGYFHVFPDDPIGSFRDNVCCITYGDDFLGTVRKEKRDFNISSYHTFLLKHGMKITLPDKSGRMAMSLDVEDADFLKRKSMYIPEIDRCIGKLDERSIFKSLHANLKSKKETQEQVAISCIEAAMHEWFAHGRQVYDKRREQMQKVCADVGLPIPAVEVTFDERVLHWEEKYSSF